jgi:hypothetical protein
MVDGLSFTVRPGLVTAWPTPAGALEGEQAAPCGREPRCGMLELVRSRVAGGAGQCVSLGLAAQLGGPGRGQVVGDGRVHGGPLVVWMVVLGRLDGAQCTSWRALSPLLEVVIR